ncbi:hypothetical protein BJ742DRAFT_773701 [Cladochytrium replicatum]|nr:hypothetical protein BJ742DRAFT_773701 [Cladochytrium replicatum]
MTRSFEHNHKNDSKDRHGAKCYATGNLDVRGLPKKQGAGKGNWGSTDDYDEEIADSDSQTQVVTEQKIKVVTQEEAQKQQQAAA